MRTISVELDKKCKYVHIAIDSVEKYRTKEVDAEGSEGEDYRGFQLETKTPEGWTCPEEDEAAYSEFSSAFRALMNRVVEEAVESLEE